MIYLAIVLFALAAAFGLSIFIKWLTRKDASRAVIFTHGGVAAAGLVLLIVYALQHPGAFPKVSLILFVIAALGGFYLFFRDMGKKGRPLPVAVVHALLAVAGFIALLAYVI